MKYLSLRRFFASVLALALLFTIPIGAASAEETKEISVAGVPLFSNTPYTVYLEPTAYCTPSFEPVYVTIRFKSATSCTLTYNGQSIAMARFNNKKYIDLVSKDEEWANRLTFNGTCDTNCAGADFAVRVTDFFQGEAAPPVFGAPTPEPEIVIPEPEDPVTFHVSGQTLVLHEEYRFLITPDESCDKEFEPFVIPMQFNSEIGGWFVTSKYKNVSSAYPFIWCIEDSGWVEIRSGHGKIWGIVDAGGTGADFTLRLVGLEKEDTIAQLFQNVTYRKGREPEPEPAPLRIGDYDPKFYVYFGTLSEAEKSVYTQLAEALSACEETVTLAYPVSNADLYRIYACVRDDQPQLFWIDLGCVPAAHSTSGLVTKVRLCYNSLVRNLPQAQAQVNAAADRILSAVWGMSDLEAERYIHDLLIRQITYVAQCPNSQNLYSSLVSGESVCAGYSRAFQYLMQRLGIPCCYIGGKVPDQGSIYEGRHAWNLVKVNGDWYNVDVTWDDYYKEKNKRYSCISYEFYNVTDSFISGEHTRNEDSIQMPPCTSTRASFDRLYGHNWQTEVAIAGGIPAVSSLNEYFSLCANSLKGAGIGDISCRFIVTNQATMNRIQEQSTTKEYENAYVYPFFNTSNLRNVTYYYSWQGAGLSSRGNCYYIDLTHTIKRK